MNNLVRYFVFLLSVLGTIVEINGQISDSMSFLLTVNKEVENINSMELHKAYLCYNEQKKFIVKNKLSTTDEKVYSDTLYYDESRKIRKIVSHQTYGALGGKISYFDVDGYLSYMLFYDYDQDNLIAGYMYMKNNKLLLLEGLIYNDNSGLSHPFFIKQEIVPQSIENILFTCIIHLDTLRKLCDNNLEIPENCAQVIFSLPEVNSITFTNTLNTFLYTSDSRDDAIKDSLFMGQPVLILQRTENKNNQKNENFPWYKIEYSLDYNATQKQAYISGEFLEPVEKIIE